MKKLILLLLLLVPMLAQAYDAEIDGIYYNFQNGEAEVTCYNQYSADYSGAVTIPASVTYYNQSYPVTSIGGYAFYWCSGLTSINIPNSVTSIGYCAFSGCSGLTIINIPNSVTSIGYGAFSGCSGLTIINIPNSVMSIGDWAFNFCSGLTSINIPKSVTSIGGSAFRGCSNLTSINIPNGVTSIGDYAFSFCGLTSITIPNSVTSVGDYAFSACYGLESITIPNSVTSIGDYAFSSCGLTSITIPSSVTSIGDYAFYGCPSLTSIYTASDNSNFCSEGGVLFSKDKKALITYPYGRKGDYTIPESVTSIGAEAFDGCSGLTSITIPNSVTSIGAKAFQYCSGLTSITIPNSITSIGTDAFSCQNVKELIYAEGCETTLRTYLTSIEEVTIPESVTSIGAEAFYRCSSLTSVTIPDGVTSIGYQAFLFSGLTTVSIPNSVTSIGSRAFESCSHLNELYCYAEEVPTTGYLTFTIDNIRKATLYVPEAALSRYSRMSPWTEFRDILPLPNTGETEGEDTDVTGLADALYVESQQFVPGAEIEVPLLLKNALEATGFSCTLVLPEGLSIVTDGDGYPDVTAISERFSNINYVNCYGDFNAEGNVDISCSISNTSRCKLTGNDGAVATFKLRAADKLEKGPYPVVLKNIRITNAESTAIDDVTVTFHYGKKWECTHIQGDVNGDGEVTIEDLNTLVDILLGK